MTLTEFLQREASLPGYPGACCKMADKWVEEASGFSPLRRFGREYHSREEVEAWLAEPGGIAVPFNRVMRHCGFRKTTEPRTGDVGLVFHGVQICAAIKADCGWVSRDDSGFIAVPDDAVWKAWGIV